MATGRAPRLPTVRQSHPALHPVDHAGAGDPTVEMPVRPSLRRQELAPWSPHPSTAAARAMVATPPAGTPTVGGGSAAGAEPAARHRQARRGVTWVLIGGIGLYLVIIALGLAGVLYVGRLSPPGLDRLTRPSGTTQVTTGAEGSDPASPAPAEPAGAGAATTDTTTAPPPASSTASDVDGGADATGTTPADGDPSDTPTEPSPPPPTESTTTTTTKPSGPDSNTPSETHPHGGPPGHAPGKP